VIFFGVEVNMYSRTCFMVVAALGVWMTGAAAGAAQEPPRPDFSGTWVLESAGGDLPERAVKALTKGAPQPITLVIVQSASTLQVSRETDRGTVTAVYPLDGSETIQRTPHGESKSRTRWQERSLVSTGSRPLPGPFPMGTRTVAFTETRTLSNDGSRLTVEIAFKTPRGVRTRTATFRRAG
jgi:hypothetical protein